MQIQDSQGETGSNIPSLLQIVFPTQSKRHVLIGAAGTVEAKKMSATMRSKILLGSAVPIYYVSYDGKEMRKQRYWSVAQKESKEWKSRSASPC